MTMARRLQSLKARWLEQASSLSGWQVIASLAVSALLITSALDGFLHPLTYPPGDVRGSLWFNAAFHGFLGFGGTLILLLVVTAVWRRTLAWRRK
jgi:hypothetical protein